MSQRDHYRLSGLNYDHLDELCGADPARFIIINGRDYWND